MEIIEQKKSLRQRMRQQRAQLNPEIKKAYDEWVCQQLWRRIEQKSMQIVHCYIPMGMEIDIRPLIRQMLGAKIRVVTPRTLKNRQLQHLILASLDQVEKGVFGTTFPAGKQLYQGSYDLIIVPGLAFDDHGYRLGYGGGYYDNFLVEHPEALKLGIFYPFQQVLQLPLEPHDQQLDEMLYRPFANGAAEF